MIIMIIIIGCSSRSGRSRGRSSNRSNSTNYLMLSGRISRNIGENIFRSYTGTSSEITDFHVLVA